MPEPHPKEILLTAMAGLMEMSPLMRHSQDPERGNLVVNTMCYTLAWVLRESTLEDPSISGLLKDAVRRGIPFVRDQLDRRDACGR